MAIVNSASVNGVVPASFKHAIVQLLLEKKISIQQCAVTIGRSLNCFLLLSFSNREIIFFGGGGGGGSLG